MTARSSIGVILPAGGSGVRFGADIPKQYIRLGGLPVIAHCIKTVLSMEHVDVVVIAVQEEQHGVLSDIIAECGLRDARIHLVAGGRDRQTSVLNALRHKAVDGTDVVAVHDAVRPFASRELWNRVTDAGALFGAAIPVLPVTDTLKVVTNELVTGTPDRSSIYRAQTPQAFHTSVLRHAYEQAHRDNYAGTDCASLCERAGIGVRCVAGEDKNIKITTAFDAMVAEAIVHGNG